MRRGSRRVWLFGALPLLTSMLLSGCGTGFFDSTPGNPTGSWASTDGMSTIVLNADHTGQFTLCRPDTSNEGHKYGYDATKWPSSIEITWETSYEASPKPGSGGNRVYMYQNWDEHLATNVGFQTIDRPLFWVNGDLAMGVDHEVIYRKVTSDVTHCAK